MKSVVPAIFFYGLYSYTHHNPSTSAAITPLSRTLRGHPSAQTQSSSQAVMQLSTGPSLYTQASLPANHSGASCLTEYQGILSAAMVSQAYSPSIESGTLASLPTVNKARHSAGKQTGYQVQSRIDSLLRDV